MAADEMIPEREWQQGAFILSATLDDGHVGEWTVAFNWFAGRRDAQLQMAGIMRSLAAGGAKLNNLRLDHHVRYPETGDVLIESEALMVRFA